MKITEKEMISKKLNDIKVKISNAISEEEKTFLVNDSFQDIVEKGNVYLAFEFAKKYYKFLKKKDIDKVGEIIIKSKNPYLCCAYAKFFKVKDLKPFQEVINESPIFYVYAFLKFFNNADPNYFAGRIAKECSVRENIEFIANYDIIDLKPHSQNVAKNGTAEENLEYLLTVDTFYDFKEEDFQENVQNIIESGQPWENLKYVLAFKPTLNLEKHERVITDSRDLATNFLACENWPVSCSLELIPFVNVLRLYTRSQLEGILIFQFGIKDKNFIKNILDKYFFFKKENDLDDEK